VLVQIVVGCNSILDFIDNPSVLFIRLLYMRSSVMMSLTVIGVKVDPIPI
jgi:hypothetical protein